jgi:hypothetical protein
VAYLKGEAKRQQIDCCNLRAEVEKTHKTEELKLKLIYDRQSVGQSLLVSGTHLGSVTKFSFSLLFCNALSNERTGL